MSHQNELTIHFLDGPMGGRKGIVETDLDNLLSMGAIGVVVDSVLYVYHSTVVPLLFCYKTSWKGSTRSSGLIAALVTKRGTGFYGRYFEGRLL